MMAFSRIILTSLIFLLAGCIPSRHLVTAAAPTAAPMPASEISDLREYQHGIDFVHLPNGSYVLIWSSAGNPPTGQLPDGTWAHDVYYTHIDPAHPSIHPVLLIANPEAQEPASAAISSDGHVLITMEDGWNTERTVAQRYGVYDAELEPVLPYPQMVADGGHSGHVAAAGKRFVVFYSEGWIDGGGVDDLGSGDDVWAAVYDSDGALEYTLDIAAGGGSRDWWPLVAASPEHALLVWQRFIDDETSSRLMFSLLDVENASLVVSAATLEDKVQYYAYNVVFVSALDRFLITGAYPNGTGFAYLLNTDGDIAAANTALPAPVRESQVILRDEESEALAAVPVVPSGVMVLTLTSESIGLKYLLEDEYIWPYSGTDGIFLSADTLYIVSTSPDGLVERILPLP